MIAASSYIDSEFKTEDGKAKWNQAILNSFFFCFIREVIKQKNDKVANKNQCKVINGEILFKKREVVGEWMDAKISDAYALGHKRIVLLKFIF